MASVKEAKDRLRSLHKKKSVSEAKASLREYQISFKTLNPLKEIEQLILKIF
jgi:hypothetical protein